MNYTELSRRIGISQFFLTRFTGILLRGKSEGWEVVDNCIVCRIFVDILC